jgi:hypothetical protein
MFDTQPTAVVVRSMFSFCMIVSSVIVCGLRTDDGHPIGFAAHEANRHHRCNQHSKY